MPFEPLKSIKIDKELMLENIALDFDPRVNVFIGPNGCGKTTLLRAIERQAIEAGLPCLFIPSVRIPVGRPGSHNVQPNLFAPDPALEPLFDEYSQNAQTEPTTADLMFDSKTDIFYSELVPQLVEELRANKSVDPHALAAVLNVADDCHQKICEEIVSSARTEHHVENRGSTENVLVEHNMATRTTDPGVNRPLHISELSSGIKGTFSWLRALALRMIFFNFELVSLVSEQDYLYSNDDNRIYQPLIFILDEVENHLHPTWQRKVIPELLEHFPMIQIFASTHSPFVVGDLGIGQVHRLARRESGTVSAETYPDSIMGWTSDEIARELLEILDPTGWATSEATKELRLLSSESPRDDPESEAQRQNRMVELRQRVDKNLLLGPIRAQLEAYEEHIRQLLEQHLQSRDRN